MKKYIFLVVSLFVFSCCDCFLMAAAPPSRRPQPPVGWAEHNSFISQNSGPAIQNMSSSEEKKKKDETNSFEGSYLTARGRIYVPKRECDFTPEEIVQESIKLGYSNLEDTTLLPKTIAYISWCIEQTDIKKASERDVPEWLYVFLRLAVYDSQYNFFQNSTFIHQSRVFCPIPGLCFSRSKLGLFINEVRQLSSITHQEIPITVEHAQALYNRLVELERPSLKASRAEGQKLSTPNTRHSPSVEAKPTEAIQPVDSRRIPAGGVLSKKGKTPNPKKSQVAP
jgi:hypothetical protein